MASAAPKLIWVGTKPRDADIVNITETLANKAAGIKSAPIVLIRTYPHEGTTTSYISNETMHVTLSLVWIDAQKAVTQEHTVHYYTTDDKKRERDQKDCPVSPKTNLKEQPYVFQTTSAKVLKKVKKWIADAVARGDL